MASKHRCFIIVVLGCSDGGWECGWDSGFDWSLDFCGLDMCWSFDRSSDEDDWSLEEEMTTVAVSVWLF